MQTLEMFLGRYIIRVST